MTRLHIPNLDGLVPTPGSQPAPVRCKSKASDHAPVARQSMDLAAGGDIPQPHALIRTPGGQPAPVRAESHGVNVFLVTAQASYFLSGRYVPNPDGLVITSRGQPTPIRAEGDVDHRPSERGEVAPRAPRRNVPQSNGLVIQARCQPVAIGTEGNRIDPVVAQNAWLITRKGPDFPSVRGVAKCDSIGGIFRGQPVSVTTERKSLDLLHLASHGAQLLPRRHIPKHDTLVPACRG